MSPRCTSQSIPLIASNSSVSLSSCVRVRVVMPLSSCLSTLSLLLRGRGVTRNRACHSPGFNLNIHEDVIPTLRHAHVTHFCLQSRSVLTAVIAVLCEWEAVNDVCRSAGGRRRSCWAGASRRKGQRSGQAECGCRRERYGARRCARHAVGGAGR
jgi:hypothetical protein